MKTKINNWCRTAYEHKKLFFALLSAWLCLECWVLGPFSYIPIFDTADSYFPEFLALKHEAGLNLWYRFISGGVDRLSQEMSYTNIFQLVSSVIPVWFTYQLYIFFHYFLSSYFTYQICRKHLNLSETAAVIAGVFYAFFRHDALFIIVGYDLFPFILLSLDSIYEKSKVSGFASLWIIPLAILTAATSVVSIGAPFLLLVFPLWIVFIRKRHDLRAGAQYLLFALVITLYHLPVIWSLILNGAVSQRIEAGYIMPKFTKVSFEFFLDSLLRLKWSLGTALPLLFTLLAMIYSKFKDRNLNRIFSFLIFVSTASVLVIFIKALTMKYLGVFQGFNFDRIYVAAPFFYAVCSAYALEYLPREFSIGSKKWSRSGVLVTLVAVVVFVQSIAIKKDNVMVWLRSGNYISCYFSSKMEKLAEGTKEAEPFRVATLSSSLLPDYANAYGLETTDGYPPIYSGRYYRFWGKVIEPLMEKKPFYKRYFMEWGTRIYLFPPEARPTNLVFRDYYNLNLLSLANTRYFISRAKLQDPNLLPVSEIEKPFYSLSPLDMVKIRLKENFSGNYYFYIYENKAAFPRFFLANKIRTFPDHKTLLQAMGEVSIADLRGTLYTEEKFVRHPHLQPLTASKSTIKISQYSSDRISLEVSANGTAVLVVSNTYSPFWKAIINGVAKDIFPVYDTFWGVYLDPGENQKIEFWYDPPYRLF